MAVRIIKPGIPRGKDLMVGACEWCKAKLECLREDTEKCGHRNSRCILNPCDVVVCPTCDCDVVMVEKEDDRVQTACGEVCIGTGEEVEQREGAMEKI